MRILILFAVFAALLAGCEESAYNSWDEPVIPVSLKGIEAVNIDNSGEKPVVSNASVKKEAYMVGIKWVADNIPSDDDDKFITGPIQQGEQRYESIADNYQKAIKCNIVFSLVLHSEFLLI